MKTMVRQAVPLQPVDVQKLSGLEGLGCVHAFVGFFGFFYCVTLR